MATATPSSIEVRASRILYVTSAAHAEIINVIVRVFLRERERERESAQSESNAESVLLEKNSHPVGEPETHLVEYARTEITKLKRERERERERRDLWS